MTAISMKKKIISKIETTKNKNLLADIYKLLDLADKEENLLELSDQQKKSIKNGLRNITQKKTSRNYIRSFYSHYLYMTIFFQSV